MAKVEKEINTDETGNSEYWFKIIIDESDSKSISLSFNKGDLISAKLSICPIIEKKQIIESNVIRELIDEILKSNLDHFETNSGEVVKYQLFKDKWFLDDEKESILIPILFDSNNLKPGNIEILWLKKKDENNNEFVFVSKSQPFYLRQVVSSFFKKSLTDAGLPGKHKGKIGYPPYLPTGLQPINPIETDDISLWSAIKKGAEALSFKEYYQFMKNIFCDGNTQIGLDSKSDLKKLKKKRFIPFIDTDSYNAIRVATEAFLMVNIPVFGTPDDDYQFMWDNYLEEIEINDSETIKILPYLAIITRKLDDVNFKSHTLEETLKAFIKGEKKPESCYGLILDKLKYPCFLELIWNYWHEESMMVQGMNAICRRFQNIRGGGAVDPLANIEIGPLRPLNNLLWGYIQDEQHRLTVKRRAYEYDHHYGISLQGKAVRGMRTVDSRSKFIEAFHTLLNICVKFYKQHDDTTVVADGFPVLNALKEVHMILSEGAHNQYGDLPSTARIEMLMQQYILARPEFREFLPTRQMVPYPEPWMDRVAVLNQICGWTKTNVMHYHDLGVFGEQILLSIRFGAWSDAFDRNQAANWAIFWRSQIQNYLHAYRAVTGVDLTREDGVIDTKQPSIHLLRRLNEQSRMVKV